MIVQQMAKQRVEDSKIRKVELMLRAVEGVGVIFERHRPRAVARI